MALTAKIDTLKPTITDIFSATVGESGSLVVPAGGACVRDTDVYETGGGSIHCTWPAAGVNLIAWIELPGNQTVNGTINYRVRSPTGATSAA